MTIKFTLAETLHAAKLTRAQLSELTGIRSSTISDLCNGKTTRIHIDVIQRILKVLHDWTGEAHGIESIFVYKADQ